MDRRGSTGYIGGKTGLTVVQVDKIDIYLEDSNQSKGNPKRGYKGSIDEVVINQYNRGYYRTQKALEVL